MPISEVTVNSLGDLIDKATPTEPDPKTGTGTRGGPCLRASTSWGGAGSPHSKVELIPAREAAGFEINSTS